MINIGIIEDNRNDAYKLESLIKDLFEKEHIEYNVRWHNTIIDDMDYFQNNVLHMKNHVLHRIRILYEFFYGQAASDH